jgi:hypothetical protein
MSSNAKTLIDAVVPFCPGWNRASGKKNLLALAQKGLDELYSQVDSDSLIWRGTDNQGFPPYLLTTATTYRYDINAGNLSCGALTRTIGSASHTFIAERVRKVFVDVTNTRYDYNKTWIGKPYLYSLNPYSTKQSRLYVCDVTVNSQPAMGDGPPYVEFMEDPGTETTRYFVEIVIRAPRLTAETIPIAASSRFEGALEDFIIGYVQKRESGRNNDMLTGFYNYWCPEFAGEMRAQASSDPDETLTRIC